MPQAARLIWTTPSAESPCTSPSAGSSSCGTAQSANSRKRCVHLGWHVCVAGCVGWYIDWWLGGCDGWVGRLAGGWVGGWAGVMDVWVCAGMAAWLGEVGGRACTSACECACVGVHLNVHVDICLCMSSCLPVPLGVFNCGTVYRAADRLESHALR